MGTSYFLSLSIFLTAYVILFTSTVCHAGLGGQPGGSGMDEPKTVNFKTHRNFTKSQGKLTHYGKQFVLGLLNPSHSQEETGKFEIFIQAMENNTKVRISIPYTTFNKTYNLTRDNVAKVEIPKQVLMAGKTKIENKGIDITADKDIAVYAFSKDSSGLGDGFAVHPKRSLGLEYVVTAYSGSHSNIGVVGVENDTVVSVVLNGRSRLSYNRRVYKNRDALRVSLDKLQTFHIRSRFDLSGVRIITSKPVAVFSGASCEFSEVSPNCDFVVDQVPSVKTWGREYVVHSGQSHSMQGGGLVRVTSARGGTVVRLENGMATRMGIGGVMDLVINPRWPTLITCAPFCMATLYKTHRASVNKSVVGPSVAILPATNQFLSHYTVYITKEERQSVFLNILIKCSASGGLIVNDVLLKDLVWQASESKTWCGATVKVTKVGVNTVHHRDGGTRFGVLVDGIGGRHSYSYYGGRSFQVTREEKAKKIKPTIAVKLEKIVRLKNASKSEPKVYILTTAVLSALCGIMLLSLAVFIGLRYINSKKTSAGDEEDTDAKLPDDRTYQSIRGFPRRNTLAYEEVKLPLKQSNHPSIANVLLPPGEKGRDYENLKFHQKERDSNPYVAMDEALSGRLMVEQLSTRTEENDIYLTMKKLIKDPPQETQQIQEETQEQ